MNKNNNPFDDNYFVGYVNEVNSQSIKIHFPSSSLLGKFYHKEAYYSGGHVGSFVVIEGDVHGFLARIIDVSLPESERKAISEKAILHDDTSFHPSGHAEILLSFSIFDRSKIQKTISHYPVIGARVYACSDNQIGEYVKGFGKKEGIESIHASLGKLTANNADCSVSLNALFGRHCAVVGTTGGGKSWTVAKLIETVVNTSSNKVILIDATGEYSGLDCKHIILSQDAFFDLHVLSNNDFCCLFREHSPNTSAALCEAINTLKLIALEKIDTGVKMGKNSTTHNNLLQNNIHLFYNCSFDVTQIAVQIRNECVKEGRNNIYEEDTFKLGFCSHLIARVNMFFNNPIIKNAIGLGDRTGKEDVVSAISTFLSSDQSILRIGFESLSYDFAIREIIVDFIASELLKKSRNKDFEKSPIVLFIDEAHQFLNKKISADDNNIFYLQNIDLVAKECRKYGLFLCLATQMPRDIPTGTLSQMGTFIVHRLINEQDKKSIENACSSANKSALSFLPVLGEGEALMVGVDFPMPLTLKITPPNRPPKSNTPTFSPAKKESNII